MALLVWRGRLARKGLHANVSAGAASFPSARLDHESRSAHYRLRRFLAARPVADRGDAAARRAAVCREGEGRRTLAHDLLRAVPETERRRGLLRVELVAVRALERI